MEVAFVFIPFFPKQMNSLLLQVLKRAQKPVSSFPLGNQGPLAKPVDNREGPFKGHFPEQRSQFLPVV